MNKKLSGFLDGPMGEVLAMHGFVSVSDPEWEGRLNGHGARFKSAKIWLQVVLDHGTWTIFVAQVDEGERHWLDLANLLSWLRQDGPRLSFDRWEELIESFRTDFDRLQEFFVEKNDGLRQDFLAWERANCVFDGAKESISRGSVNRPWWRFW